MIFISNFFIGLTITAATAALGILCHELGVLPYFMIAMPIVMIALISWQAADKIEESV